MTEQEEEGYMSNQLTVMVNRAKAIIKKKIANEFEVCFDFKENIYRLKLEKKSKNPIRRFFQDF